MERKRMEDCIYEEFKPNKKGEEKKKLEDCIGKEFKPYEQTNKKKELKDCIGVEFEPSGLINRIEEGKGKKEEGGEEEKRIIYRGNNIMQKILSDIKGEDRVVCFVDIENVSYKLSNYLIENPQEVYKEIEVPYVPDKIIFIMVFHNKRYCKRAIWKKNTYYLITETSIKNAADVVITTYSTCFSMILQDPSVIVIVSKDNFIREAIVLLSRRITTKGISKKYIDNFISKMHGSDI